MGNAILAALDPGRRAVIDKFARLLDDMAMPLFPSQEKFRLYREKLKNEPCPFLGGLSLRVFYQKLSEEFIKPALGAEAFGNALLARAANFICFADGALILTDSGFRQEAEPVINCVGLSNCLQVRMLRKGTTFKGDTRSWWSVQGLHTISVDNNGEIGDLGAPAKHIARIIE
jgi:hypothetical protein